MTAQWLTLVREYTTGRGQGGIDVRTASGATFWVPLYRVLSWDRPARKVLVKF